MQAVPTLAPTPPAPPQLPAIAGNGSASPTLVYRGAVLQRKELANQLSELQDTRSQLSEQLQDPMVTGANRAGLEARIGQLDLRIADIDKQIAAADLQVARAAGVPGVIQETPRAPRNGPDPETFVMGGVFVLLVPISIALAIRFLRRGKSVVAGAPKELKEVMERLSRLDHSMDSIAVEVERIGEGQRFLTRLFSESGSGRALGAGAFEGVKAKEKDGVRLDAGK